MSRGAGISFIVVLLEVYDVINICGQSYRLKDRLESGAFSPALSCSGGKKTDVQKPAF